MRRVSDTRILYVDHNKRYTNSVKPGQMNSKLPEIKLYRFCPKSVQRNVLEYISYDAMMMTSFSFAVDTLEIKYLFSRFSPFIEKQG